MLSLVLGHTGRRKVQQAAVTVQEMCLLLAIIVHDQRYVLKDYCSTLGQYFMAFYRNTVK